MMERKIDESSIFLKSMTDRKTPKLYEEIRELKMNNIVLKDSLNDTGRSLDHDISILDRSEFLEKRLS